MLPAAAEYSVRLELRLRCRTWVEHGTRVRADAYLFSMPKRTTALQTIVREHFAAPGVEVTESKMLHDAVLEEEREADVVIEGLAQTARARDQGGAAIANVVACIQRGRVFANSSVVAAGIPVRSATV